MEKLRLTLLSLALVLTASLALSCGANSTPGQLQSITISPATATAGLPGQTVQFTATGHYSAAPYAVTPQPATWGACPKRAHNCGIGHLRRGGSVRVSGRTDRRLFDLRLRPDQL